MLAGTQTSINDLPRPCLHTIKCVQVEGLIPWNSHPVGTNTAFTPAGTIPWTPGRDFKFTKPGRDFCFLFRSKIPYHRPELSLSAKVFPTETIFVWENKPEWVYFVSLPPILSSLSMPITRPFRASRTWSLNRSRFAKLWNLLFFESFHAYNIQSRLGFLHQFVYRSVLSSLVFLPQPGL